MQTMRLTKSPMKTELNDSFFKQLKIHDEMLQSLLEEIFTPVASSKEDGE